MQHRHLERTVPTHLWSQPRLRKRRQERQKGRILPHLRSARPPQSLHSGGLLPGAFFLISVEYMAFGYMYVDDYQYRTCRLNMRSDLLEVGEGGGGRVGLGTRLVLFLLYGIFSFFSVRSSLLAVPCLSMPSCVFLPIHLVALSHDQGDTVSSLWKTQSGSAKGSTMARHPSSQQSTPWTPSRL